MAVIEIAKIQVRRGQENLTGIPQLAPGEFGWAQDTENLYIGKRIVEGANNDENSRILTQKDYDNLFAIAMGAGRASVASTSTYRYRDNLEFSLFQSTTTTIGSKLDAFVSLTDFGVKASSTATDIYTKLSTAISNLYANIYFYGETRRKLIIPAGNYYLSNTINLPPYAQLVGEGPGLTNIISLTNDRPLFRTVDANGVVFESTMAEQQSQAGSKQVLLKGMTLAYSASTSTVKPLVSFDNTKNSKIEDIEFTIVKAVNTNTGTILIHTSTIYGTGLSLRGERRTGIEQNKDVLISNCSFNNIGLAVLGTGSVANTVIEGCEFAELQQGINFSAFDGDVYRLAPSRALITKNNFNNIVNQAIFIGTSTDQTNFKPNLLNHISSFNFFKRVGNGPALGDALINTTFSVFGTGTTSENIIYCNTASVFTGLGVSGTGVGVGAVVTGIGTGTIIVSVSNTNVISGNLTFIADTGTAVISNFGEGFNSIGDRFIRKEVANPNIEPRLFNFFYKPLIEGNAIIDNGSPVEITNLSYGKQIIERLYVGPEPLSISIPYVLQDGGNKFSRSGKLTITLPATQNYTSTPEGSISDYYDYSFDPTWPVATTGTSFDLSGSLIQPTFSLEQGQNNSYVNLVYIWPVTAPPSTVTFIGTITNVSNSNPAIVTTQGVHGLSSGTQIILQGILGMNNFFSTAGSTEFYTWVLSNNTFGLYWDSTLKNSLDTTSLSLYNPASTASVIMITQSSQLTLKYQTNIIS